MLLDTLSILTNSYLQIRIQLQDLFIRVQINPDPTLDIARIHYLLYPSCHSDPSSSSSPSKSSKSIETYANARTISSELWSLQLEYFYFTWNYKQSNNVYQQTFLKTLLQSLLDTEVLVLFVIFTFRF